MKPSLKDEMNKGYKALSLLCTLGYFSCIVMIVISVVYFTKDIMSGFIMLLGSMFSGVIIYVISKIGVAVFLIRDEIGSNETKSLQK